MTVLDRTHKRGRQQRASTIELITSTPTSRRRPSPECGCGQLIAHGRTTHGHDVILDAGADGRPRVFTHGSFLEVATTPDILGRRALLVAPSATGQFRVHACPTTER